MNTKCELIFGDNTVVIPANDVTDFEEELNEYRASSQPSFTPLSELDLKESGQMLSKLKTVYNEKLTKKFEIKIINDY